MRGYEGGQRRFLLMVLTAVIWVRAGCLDNGVALTPPMGWLSWERFECNTECDVDRDNCIGEWLIMEMADVMVSKGYRDAGYQFVAIDDCMLAHERDADGKLQPDPRRFPSGMKALSDYLHERGLKFGVYEDVGTKTCAGLPGSEHHMETDAQTLADWGVDMLKFDGCNADIPVYEKGFPAMARYLNATGRHIVYSCEWPMYQKAHGGQCDYELMAATCNMLRQLTDIYDSWGSVLGMIQYFGDDPGNFSSIARPGVWNDPDQVVIGNFGLSHDQERAQMALFAILASPLMVSADFRHMRDSSRDILLNPRVIAINQDALGVQGARIKKVGPISIWRKPVTPSGSFAFAILNSQNGGYPLKIKANMTSDLMLTHAQGYSAVEVFEGTSLGKFSLLDDFVCVVNPSGVFLMKMLPL